MSKPFAGGAPPDKASLRMSPAYLDDFEDDDPPPPDPSAPGPLPLPLPGEGEGCYEVLPCPADSPTAAPTPPAGPTSPVAPALLFAPPGPDYRAVDGFPGYLVGADRSVWSNKPKYPGGPSRWWRLAMWRKARCLFVSLWQEGRAHRKSVNRLYRDAFAPAAPPLSAGLRSPPVAPRPEVARGSRHGMALLDEDKVRQARRLRRGGWTTGQLARRFAVGRNTMCYALNGTTWGHVDDVPPLPRPPEGGP